MRGRPEEVNCQGGNRGWSGWKHSYWELIAFVHDIFNFEKPICAISIYTLILLGFSAGYLWHLFGSSGYE